LSFDFALLFHKSTVEHYHGWPRRQPAESTRRARRRTRLLPTGRLRWRRGGWNGVPKAPNWLFFAIRKNFFGAIWCDLVRLGANWGQEVQGSKFKVQGSRFKVQGSTWNWKRQKLPVRAALRFDQTLLADCFHFYWV
jgi:hypothetical protein